MSDTVWVVMVNDFPEFVRTALCDAVADVQQLGDPDHGVYVRGYEFDLATGRSTGHNQVHKTRSGGNAVVSR